jgi:hypothetical protein
MFASPCHAGEMTAGALIELERDLRRTRRRPGKQQGDPRKTKRYLVLNGKDRSAPE